MSSEVDRPGGPIGSRLELLGGPIGICRLGPDADQPGWARADGSLPLAVLRSADELSVACAEHLIPEAVERSGGWSCLRVAGPLDHDQVGILAAIAAPLAEAAIPIFAISSFDTDYLLVPAEALSDARQALERAGHDVSAG